MTLPDASPNKSRVRSRFARRAASYERHAGLQRAIAAKLANHLPALQAPAVLEIGCGTGFLTHHLLERYPEGEFLITDIAPAMVEACRANSAGDGRARFEVRDGEADAPGGDFDLIVSSMVLQWFDNPAAGLARLRASLRPGGELLYAASGPDFLAEWAGVMRSVGFALDGPETADLPGVFEEERLSVEYGSAQAMLEEFRGSGALQPLGAASPLTPGRLRRAMARFERDCGARTTWHVLYGRLLAE